MKKRLFVAAPISPGAAKALSLWLKEVIKSDLVASGQIRVTPAENLHITVCFLGSVEEKYISGIEATLRQITQNSQPLTLRFKGINPVPVHRPRMIWAVFAKNAEFNVLVTRVAKELENYFKKATGRKVHLLPEREIVPHMTLARIKGNINKKIQLPEVVQIAPFKISSLEFFASQTLPSGPVYTNLAQFRIPTG